MLGSEISGQNQFLRQEKGLENGLTMSFVRTVKSKSDKVKTENLMAKSGKIY